MARNARSKTTEQPLNVGSFKVPSPSDEVPATSELVQATPVAVVSWNAFTIFYNDGHIWKMDTPFNGGDDKFYYTNKEDAMKRSSDLKWAGYDVKVFACQL